MKRLYYIYAMALVASLSSAAVFSPGSIAARAAEETRDRQSAAADTLLYVVPPIVVEATRRDPYADLFDRSGFVAAVDMRERKDRVEDLAAVLSQMVGVRVKQYGGLGDFATVSIRGSSAGHVNVYLDGIPMNDAYTGITNLADLPLGGVQRLEVYRGFSPPHLGSGAIGGAVNLVTTDRTRWNGRGTLSDLEVYASYGSFDTSRQLVSVWLQPWRLRVFAHASHTRTQGNFTFVDDNGTPVNLDDDELADRANNDSESYGFTGRLEFDIPGLDVASVTLDGYDREQGVAGLGSNQSQTARYDRTRRVGYAKLETRPFFFNQFVLSGTGFYSRRTEQFSDPDGTVALGRQDTDNRIDAWGGLGRGRWFVPLLPMSIDAVFEGRTEQFHPVDKLAQTVGPDRWRRSYTTALSGEAYLLRQTLVLTAVQRWQRHVNEFWDAPRFPWLPPSPQGRVAMDRRSPSAGFRWTPARAITIKGNVGRYYRLPTFLELFGNLGSVTGNSDLEPEEGFNRDVGVILEFERAGFLRRVFLEAVFLDSEVTNLILFFPNSQQTTKPTNIGSAVIRGWECSMATSIGARLQFSANYTRLHTEDTSDIPYYNGNRLPGRPEDDLMLVAAYRADRWTVTWEGHYIGANFLDRANMREVPGRNLQNVILELVPAVSAVRGLSLAFEARNVTDDQVSDVSGFPLPGRSFYATVSYKK